MRIDHTAGLSLGNITIHRIVEMEYPFLPPTDICAEATAENLAPHRTWLEPHAQCPETGKLIFAFQSYLVRTSHHTILIDTCIGCDKSEDWHAPWHKRQSHVWLDRLRAAGVRPEAVDFVFCTHLHQDHTGWNTRLLDGRWVPTFPNAAYVLSRADYEANAESDEVDFRENVVPVVEAKQARLVESDFSLDDEVWLEPTPGHTPGHVAVHLSSRGERAVMCGDLMHTPIQCAHPEWNAVFDWNHDLARATRRRFLETQCSDRRLVLTAHFPSPSIGYVVAQDDAFRFSYR